MEPQQVASDALPLTRGFAPAGFVALSARRTGNLLALASELPYRFWHGRFQQPDRCRRGRHPHRRACVFLGLRSHGCAVVCPTDDGWHNRTGGSRPPDGCEQKDGAFRNIVRVLVNGQQSRAASSSKMTTQRNLSCVVAMRTLCDGHLPRTLRICFRRWSTRGPSCRWACPLPVDTQYRVVT